MARTAPPPNANRMDRLESRITVLENSFTAMAWALRQDLEKALPVIHRTPGGERRRRERRQENDLH